MQQIIGLMLSVGVSLSAIVAPAWAQPTADATPATPGFTLPPIAGEEAWNVYHTLHFSIAYNGDEQRATLQGQLLEATYQRFFEALGVDEFHLTPVDERLVSLFFEKKDAYLDYARQADRVDMSWTVAYYSARTNRIAFYHYGPHRRSADADARTADATDQLYGSAVAEPVAAAAPTTGASLFDQLAREHRISIASATHEAAHQLAFNSGLQKRGVLYPLWVSEGLATCFELSAADGSFGPDADNPTRRRRLQRVFHAGDLLSLHAFAAVTRPPTDDARATEDYYAHSWGLFRFLYLHHRQALGDYLAELAALPRGNRSRDTLRAEFQRHFGPIDQVEHAWHAWIAGL